MKRKAIIGFENYKILNTGLVKSLPRLVPSCPWGKWINRKTKERILKPYKNPKNGYWYIILPNKEKTKALTIHRLVATHFINNPLNLPEVNHKFGNKDENSVEKLEWVTKHENAKHAYHTGLHPIKRFPGTSNSNSKLKHQDVIDIRESILPIFELAKKYRVTSVTINNAKSKRTYSNIQ